MGFKFHCRGLTRETTDRVGGYVQEYRVTLPFDMARLEKVLEDPEEETLSVINLSRVLGISPRELREREEEGLRLSAIKPLDESKGNVIFELAGRILEELALTTTDIAREYDINYSLAESLMECAMSVADGYPDREALELRCDEDAFFKTRGERKGIKYHPSFLIMDKYVRGELPRGRELMVSNHINKCDRCSQTLARSIVDEE